MTDPRFPSDHPENLLAARMQDEDLGLEEPAAGTPLRELATEEPATVERVLPGRRARVVLELAGGATEEFEVRVDNRDYLRWDKTAPRQKWGNGRDVPFLMATFLAWSAASRAGLTSLKWSDFEAAAVVVDDIAQEDEDLARPTQ
jgi:hypothetical protein